MGVFVIMKNLLKRLTVPLCIFLTVLILYSAAMFSVLEVPFTFVWHLLPPGDFLGKFTYEELKDGNNLHIVTFDDNRSKDYSSFKLGQKSTARLDDILNGHSFKTALIDYSFSGSASRPKNQIAFYRYDFGDDKNNIVLISHRGGTVSYGITAVYLLKDRVIICREFVGENSYSYDEYGFVPMHPSRIPYYCKDPELVAEMRKFVNEIL